MRRRALAGFLTLLLVVSTVLSANMRTAAAAVTEADYQSAARQLNKYGLVQGDNRGYRFYDQITRAELAKLLVYSLGMESEASRYVGRGTFPDTGGHWAEGIIGVAKSMGLLRGDGEGNFRPQAPLTNAEAVTALARMAGLDATSEAWPRTYWNPAVDAGIVPGEMEATLRAGLNEAANRGDVFVLLWRTLTEVKNFDGQNLLRRYLDRTPPAITLDPLPESTGDMMLTVTGTVKDALKVLVNGQPATVSELGYFSGSVPLRKGPNTVRVQAVDDAGNAKEVTAQVTRADSPVGAIALVGPATVPAGSTARYTVLIKDQNGETMTGQSQVTARVEPADLGTFDPAAGTFTAGARPGSGQIVVTAGGAMGFAPVTVSQVAADQRVASVRLEAPATRLPANGVSEWTMTATVLDAKDAVVTDYQGPLTVTSSNTAVAAPVSAQVVVTNGVGTVVVRAGSSAGAAVITVKAGLDKAASATVNTDAQRLQAIRLSGVPVPSANTEPTAYVEAVALDTEGNPMRSALPQVVAVHLKLNATTAKFIQNGTNEADIALGAVNPETGDVRTRTMVQYTPGTGTQVIQGEILATSQKWIQVYYGAFQADQAGAPAKLRIETPVEAAAGQPQTVYVNVLDAEGYRVTIDLLLSGINVTLRDNNGVVWPVKANAAGAGPGRVGFDVVQTQAGTYTYTATLQPNYATTTAQGVVVPGEATQLKLQADPAELVADNRARTTLRAEVRDSYGNLIKASYPVTFRRVTNNGALQAFGEQTVYTRDGVAQFQVTAGTVIGQDQVEAVVLHPLVPNGRISAPVTLVTRGAPERLVIRYGDNDGDGTAGGPQDYQGRVGRPLTVFVDVLDPFGNVVAADQGRSISLTVRNQSSPQQVQVLSAATVSGRALFSITRNDAADYALKAESGELMRSLTVGFGGSVADARIQPGGTLRLKAVADIATLEAGGGANYAEIKAQLLDAQNNPTPNQTGRPVAVTLSFPNDTNQFNWGFFTVDDSAGGVKTWTRTVFVAPGASESQPVRFYSGNTGTSRTITAATLDGVTGTVTVSSTTLAAGAKLAILTVQPAPLQPWTGVAGATDGQTVIVEAQDPNGNRLTRYNGAITLRVQDADSVIVAIRQNKVLVPVDTLAGSYRQEYWAMADRGRAEFVVRSNTPGMKLYQVTAVDGINLPPDGLTATGRFDGQPANRLDLETPPARVKVGDQVTLRARLYDAYNTWLPSAGGTVTFSDGAGFTHTASAANGVFSAVYTASAPGDVTITATSSLPGVPARSVTIQVDGVGPQASVTLTQSRADVNPGRASEGDTISFAFDDTIDGASVLAALRAGITLTSGLGTVRFEDDTTDRIVFDGLPALGALTWTGDYLSSDATFHVAAISLDGAGKVLTLRLGARLTGTADPLVTANSPMQWNVPQVKDSVGNLAPDQPVTVTGTF